MVAVGQEPFRGLVVMLVHQIQPLLPGVAPAHVVGLPVHHGACAADQADGGILLPDGPGEQRHVLMEPLVDFLVAHRQVVQAEGRGMAHLRADAAPAGIRRALGELDQIHSVLNVLLQKRPLGKAQMMGIQPAVDHRQRLATNVLAEEEVFVEAQPHGLVVAPVVAAGGTVLHRAQGALPVVDAVARVGIQHAVVSQAAAGEAQEAGLHVRQGLGDVPAQHIGLPRPGIGGHQGHKGHRRLAGILPDQG